MRRKRLATAFTALAMKIAGGVAGAAILAPSPMVADDQDIRCTVELNACGSLEGKLSPLTSIQVGSCYELQLFEGGKRQEGLLQSAHVWIGAGVSADTLILGKGEAKTGVLIKCEWKPGTASPKEKLESLKASVPELLKDERFAKQFPGIKKIDTSGLKVIERPNQKCAQAIAEFAKSK